ncbi:MAG: flagellar hook-associated protein FlgK [Lachnospiraceae bacterium]|nr:flagellar hook-associated protein FlgK [Lachnospiraceae bacterium]
MSGFGSMYVGVSGLRTAQDALNTTAHNLSNLETEGYVRQQIVQGDRMYTNIGYASISSMQVGLGVELSDIRQVRDDFLDQEYRKEVGRAQFYMASYEACYEIENYFQELDGCTYQETIKDLWESVAELAKEPESKVKKEYFILKASEFLQRSTAIDASIKEYQENLNRQVTGKIDRINELGHIIKYYNDKVVGIELGGAEDANDYRDARNQALDELAELANISYSVDAEGYVTVKIEGSQFINRDRVNEMGYTTDLRTGFYTPIWKHEGDAPVFDLSLEISTQNDTNVGALKALVMARGDRYANYTDIAYLNQAVEDGTMSSDKAALIYTKETAYSSCMKVQAEFDQMVHGIVTAINDVLCMDNYQSEDGPVTELFIRIGEAERFQKDANGDYLLDADGYYIPIEEENHLLDEKGRYTAVREGNNAYKKLYTVGNLMINPAVLANSSLIDFTKDNGATDYNGAELLMEKWSEEFATLNPTEESKMKFSDYYTGFQDALANMTQIYKGIAEGQESMANKTDSARQEIMGVSSDEELTNMIRFQNAYNASSRYINVINEMLEHLLNTLGV